MTGYTYRSIEEIIVKKKSDKLSESDKISLMTSLFAEAGDDLKRSCYKVLDSRNDLDNRVLFCLSLRWDNRHMKYQLAEDNYQNKWCSLILSQNVLTSLKHHENIFKLLLPGANVKIMVNKKRSAIEDGVQQDFLFGYIVKLAESLNPYE